MNFMFDMLVYSSIFIVLLHVIMGYQILRGNIKPITAFDIILPIHLLVAIPVVYFINGHVTEYFVLVLLSVFLLVDLLFVYHVMSWSKKSSATGLLFVYSIITSAYILYMINHNIFTQVVK